LQINKLLKPRKLLKLLKNQMLLHSRKTRQKPNLTRLIKLRKKQKRPMLMLNMMLKQLIKLRLMLIKKL